MLARRAFLAKALWGVPLSLLSWSAWLSACGDSTSSSDSQKDSSESNCSTDGTCDTSGDYNWSISSNHGHAVDLTKAEVGAGDPVTVTLSTGNDHTHTLDLTPAMLGDVDDGQLLMVESSTTNGHSHCVSFNCGMSSSGGGGGYGY